MIRVVGFGKILGLTYEKVQQKNAKISRAVVMVSVEDETEWVEKINLDAWAAGADYLKGNVTMGDYIHFTASPRYEDGELRLRMLKFQHVAK